jgi:arylsulfatase A-like enzyme
LAAEGVVYENAFTSGIWTLESVASLYTGLYASQHGVDIHHQTLSPEPTTLASYLQMTYSGAAFAPGSWHSRSFGFDRGFEHFQETYRPFTWLDRLFPTETFPEKVWRHFGYRYDKGARGMNWAAKKWLDSRSDDRPFFMVVHYIEPHLPYRLPEPFYSRFLPAGISKSQAKRVNQDAYKLMAHEVEMSEEDFEILNALYDGALNYLDFRIDELTMHLAARGILDDTLLIIMADHGENLGEHGLMDHQYSVHDTLLHVPLVMRLPGTLPAGTRETKLVQNIDIFPTLIEFVGGSVDDLPNDLRGQNIFEGESGHEFTISEYLAPVFRRFEFAHPRFDYGEYDRQLRAIRTTDYKLIWSSDGNHELYQVSVDPYEQHNLIEAQSDVAGQLEQKLQQWESSIHGPTWQRTSPEIDPVVEGRLRELGYL